MDYATPFDFASSGCARDALDVRFSFYSADEIRKVSVKKITSIEAFGDVGGIPTDSGLHAPQLGPMQIKKDKGAGLNCPTCGLDADCPGHMGHIELACSCYNPFLFLDLVKLLRRTCLSCGGLKIRKERTDCTVRSLMSLSPGKLAKSAQLPAPSKKSPFLGEAGPEEAMLLYEEDASTGETKLIWTEPKDLNEQVNHSTEQNSKVAGAMEQAAASQEIHEEQVKFRETACLESFREVLKEYLTDFPASKCANCSEGGKSPAKWRKEGYAKLFVGDMFCLPIYVKKILKELWEKEADILRWMIPGSVEHGHEIFFLECLLVPPNRFRPPTISMGISSSGALSDQSAAMREILVRNERMRLALQPKSATVTPEDTSKKRKYIAPGDEDAPIQGPVQEFQGLQDAVNSFLDCTKGMKNVKQAKNGVRQILEKKEGLFRMKMMGKRVNQAARSVIAPDPNIETNEVGVPRAIAQELTYPEVANMHNAEYLRDLVLRGDCYPGAKEVHVPKSNGSKKVHTLSKLNKEQRERVVKEMDHAVDGGHAHATVLRHIRDGDPLLVNRQPTLHKPGIMAHSAKVMCGGESTIRLHYANCNTYNADFDGDEMNLHAPQDPCGRVEALGIARAERQYLVPTSGKPLRGLIQDHVIGGVMLTRRDCYLSKSEACNLLYVGLRAALENGDLASAKNKTKPLKRLASQGKRYPQKSRIQLDEPALMKPRKLWTGKQVLSMLLKNLLIMCGKGKELKRGGMNLESKSKTPGDIWGAKLDGNKEEGTVLFRGTELLMGVLDKNSFGATSYSLVHLFFELVGPKSVDMVLTSFARLFTQYLQMRGFSCAYADLILTEPTEEHRTRLIAKSRRIAQETIKEWLSKHEVEVPTNPSSQELTNKTRALIEGDAESANLLEATMLNRMGGSWTDTIDACIPVGLKLKFPLNCMNAMTTTGAKGSKVNQSQISCLLGQQELEGRQVPLMPTRRSLPCFQPYDLSSRTRGFITDRFLTGVRPQEFFFHCMAGREGLVDTAVKTSRSGYLQRCLVKHLECLKVGYDHTVRDADGTVVQFLYGDDGVDVMCAQHLFKFDILLDNYKMVQRGAERGIAELRRVSSGPLSATEMEAAPLYFEAQQAAQKGNIKSAEKKLDALAARSAEMKLDEVACEALKQTRERLHEHGQKQEGKPGNAQQLFEPMSSVLSPCHFFGSTSELHESEMQKFLANAMETGKCSKEEAEAFAKFMRLKFMKSLAQPGEAVGVIAAQSMGEPSTQMTLNTFHLAGHGGANVTLGIPRLREIVQTASANLSTPTMKIEVLRNLEGSSDLADRKRFAMVLASRFRRVALLDMIRNVIVETRVKQIGGEVVRTYLVRLEFWPLAELQHSIPHLNPVRIEEYMTKDFVRLLHHKIKNTIAQTKQEQPRAQKAKRGADEGAEDTPVVDDEGNAADAEGKAGKKKRRLGRGERDGDEQEENVAAEEEEAAKADDKDDGGLSDASGMYESTDDEKGEPAEEDGEMADEIQGEDGEGTQLESGGKGEQDKEVEEPGTKENEPEALLNERTRKGGKTNRSQESILQAAMNSGSIVWAGKLEENAIDLVVTLKLDTCANELLIGELVRSLAGGPKAQFQDPDAGAVTKVHVQVDNKDKVWLECEGTNLQSFHLLPKGTVDVDHISTNDIAKTLQVYGVEAARASIVKEICNVFGHYGIEVNHRHLSLIADFMSMAGGFRAFNRKGMTNCTSPFLQMSFETTMQFCQAACQDGLSDSMVSPSSAICIGQPAQIGTGMVNILVDLEDEGPKEKVKKVLPKPFNFS